MCFPESVKSFSFSLNLLFEQLQAIFEIRICYAKRVEKFPKGYNEKGKTNITENARLKLNVANIYI